MSLSTLPYKGARDFYPEDKRIQSYMFGVMRKVVEGFGYQEYDAPILEPTDLFLMKGNEEIINDQTYTFTDRGDRSVTIRTEMTPSVSRMVAAKRQELAYPLRWYSIPNLWRYERPQRGRLREFWQLNVDIFGVSGIEADHEIILIADNILKAFGAKPEMYSIKVSSRQLMHFLLHDHFRLEETQVTTLMRLIDRMHKLPEPEFVAMVEALLSPMQREQGLLAVILEVLRAKQLSDLPQDVQGHPSAKVITTLMEQLTGSGVSSAVFDISLMRGFDYYTDIVFEVFDNHPENNRSLFGGGRYDGLVANFGVETIPVVGFGLGDVSLQNFLESHDLLPKLPSSVDAVAILIGDHIYGKAQKTLKTFRDEGVRLAIDSTNRKLDKQLRSADKAGVRYVVFIGDQELETERFKLKNLKSGLEEEHGIERIISILAAQHKTDDQQD